MIDAAEAQDVLYRTALVLWGEERLGEYGDLQDVDVLYVQKTGA